MGDIRPNARFLSHADYQIVVGFESVYTELYRPDLARRDEINVRHNYLIIECAAENTMTNSSIRGGPLYGTDPTEIQTDPGTTAPVGAETTGRGDPY
jgi:hypothetical protein